MESLGHTAWPAGTTSCRTLRGFQLSPDNCLLSSGSLDNTRETHLHSATLGGYTPLTLSGEDMLKPLHATPQIQILCNPALRFKLVLIFTQMHSTSIFFHSNTLNLSNFHPDTSCLSNFHSSTPSLSFFALKYTQSPYFSVKYTRPLTVFHSSTADLSLTFTQIHRASHSFSLRYTNFSLILTQIHPTSRSDEHTQFLSLSKLSHHVY